MLCRDPNLWLVKCRMGEEKATAIALMRKFIAYQFTDEVRIAELICVCERFFLLRYSLSIHEL